MRGATLCVALLAASLAFAVADNVKGGGEPNKVREQLKSFQSDPSSVITGEIQSIHSTISGILGASPSPPPAGGPSPPGSTAPPVTGPNMVIETIEITENQANAYQPELLQDGFNIVTPAGDDRYDFGTDTEPPQFDGNFMRFVVIGDWGRQQADQTVDQCGVASGIFNGTDGHSTDNELQGALQQKETALLLDQVCGLIGGCQFVIGTGDNFYDCGVNPGSNARYFSDWFDIYQTSATPNIQGVPWYNTFGNHDIVINGSVETEISFTNDIFHVGQTYAHTFTSPDGTVTAKAMFVDANPFITKYNSPTSGYYTEYYQTHHNAPYVEAQAAFVTEQLTTAPALYNFVVAHYPLFGTSTQYGLYSSNGQAFPGQFNGWQLLYNAINNGKVNTYFNGHDHTMTVGNPDQPGTNGTYNGVTSYMTSGAGSWGETGDSCGDPGSWFYSDGGNGGFIIMTANASVWRADYYTLGSTFSQCTVTQPADKSAPPTYHANCALGQPNACCIENTECY